mmetsp:Transcript_63294/g.167732  ORF Transcript_63294/g.167732 Transcript_63294/m.167732 type:complete len:219 (-) Transcript_63294:276-932(-)
MQGTGDSRVVLQTASGVGVLQQSSAELGHGREIGGLVVTHDQLHADPRRARLHHVDGLRVHFVAHKELVLRFRVHGARKHGHGLCSSRALVQQGRICCFHACELTDEGLIVHQRLHATLRNFCLVRRVRCVPRRILQEVARDDVWNQSSVVTHAEEVLRDHVLREDRFRQRQGVRLTDLARRHVELRVAKHRRRDRLFNQLLDVLHTDDGAHLLHVFG